MMSFIIPLMMWFIENYFYIAPIYDRFVCQWQEGGDPDEIYTIPG